MAFTRIGQFIHCRTSDRVMKILRFAEAEPSALFYIARDLLTDEESPLWESQIGSVLNEMEVLAWVSNEEEALGVREE